MDNLKYDWNEICQRALDIASKKYKYNEYRSGQELVNVLKKLVPEMLEGASYYECRLFISMLLTTPILIIPEENEDTPQEIMNKIFGHYNPYVDSLNSEEDLKNKPKANAAFCSCPILDSNGEVIAVKKFLYVRANYDVDKILNETVTEPRKILAKNKFLIFGTHIDVSALAHELGHAWVSQHMPYKKEGDIIIERCGSERIYQQIVIRESGRCTLKEVAREGMATEEALDTNIELRAVAKYLNITVEKLQEYYDHKFLWPSAYQGELSNLGAKLMDSELGQDVRAWRLNGNKDATDKLNRLMGKSSIYINREADRQDEQEAKRILDSPEENGVTDFGDLNRIVFFPDKKVMTPLQLFNNAMDQCFAVSCHKKSGRNIPDDVYQKLIGPAIRTAETLLDDAVRALKEEKNKGKDDKNITE